MRFLTAPLLALALTSSLSLANPVPKDEDSFQALARDADDTALHAALHAKKEYKHGIFPHDRHALEAVRREHEEEALQIVKFALMRRQDNSTTTATTSTTSTSSTTSTTATTDLTTTTTTQTTKTDTSTTDAPTTDTTTETDTTTTTTGDDISVTSATSFTTTRTTTITNDEGQAETVTQTDVVIITPTPTGNGGSSKTTTGPPGLQTPAGDAGKLEFGWMKVGMAVVAGVGGMVL